ncbi:hypothetical protein FRC19_002858 [Serendipita sp. 401]|nr:hypothetical protein FRC19_002858 [Serendipita sp. 401]
MAAADQAILDQIQKLSGNPSSQNEGVLRQARDTDPTRSQSGSSSNHGPYQYSYRGRGRYQYPKFAPSRPLTTSKNVEIGGEVFKASSNKLTRQVTPAGSSTPVASSASAPVQPTSQSRAQRFASRGTYRSNQNRTQGYKPRGRRHHNMSLILNKAQPKKEKVEKQCPFFSRTGTCNRGKSCRYQHDSEKRKHAYYLTQQHSIGYRLVYTSRTTGVVKMAINVFIHMSGLAIRPQSVEILLFLAIARKE